jgi:hypothetical protein
MTAVEWLEQEIFRKYKFTLQQLNCQPLEEAIQQAKEMEKEQGYSEEEVLPLLEMLQKCKEYFLLKTDKYSDERADAIIDVMEQFKKK